MSENQSFEPELSDWEKLLLTTDPEIELLTKKISDRLASCEVSRQDRGE